MPHNVASDQGLHCLQTRFSIKNRVKATNRHGTPKTTNGLVQHITVEESTCIQWVKNVLRINYLSDVILKCNYRHIMFEDCFSYLSISENEQSCQVIVERF